MHKYFVTKTKQYFFQFIGIFINLSMFQYIHVGPEKVLRGLKLLNERKCPSQKGLINCQLSSPTKIEENLLQRISSMLILIIN